MTRVLVTEAEYSKAQAVFRQSDEFVCEPAPAEEEKLAAAVRRTGARHVIVGPAPYRDALYRTLPAGGVIARFGAGHDGVDKRKANEAGLLCTNTPGQLDESVADSEANAKMARRALKNLELGEEGRLREMDILNPEALG